MIDKIPYLKELGITMVELLPVQQFDPQEGNYWGYMTLNFFAPHGGYASDARQPATNSARWSAPCTRRTSRSSSTSSTTTRPRPARTGRPTAIAESTTSPTT